MRAWVWFDVGMKFGTRSLVAWWILLCPSFAWAGGRRGGGKVSFHIETEGTDNPKMIFPYELFGKQRFFRRLPEVSSRDFVAYSPFPSEDQASYGAVFQLKDNARRRLAAVTATSIGRWLVCHAFGRVIDGVMIDEAVDDGVIVVWRGLSLTEGQELDKGLPRVGEKKKK